MSLCVAPSILPHSIARSIFLLLLFVKMLKIERFLSTAFLMLICNWLPVNADAQYITQIVILCTNVCLENNYTLFGLSYEDGCHCCGNVEMSDTREGLIVLTEECNLPCTGDPGCDGNVSALYRGEEYIGCYVTCNPADENTSWKTKNTMTIKVCAARYANSTYHQDSRCFECVCRTNGISKDTLRCSQNKELCCDKERLIPWLTEERFGGISWLAIILIFLSFLLGGLLVLGRPFIIRSYHSRKILRDVRRKLDNAVLTKYSMKRKRTRPTIPTTESPSHFARGKDLSVKEESLAVEITDIQNETNETPRNDHSEYEILPSSAVHETEEYTECNAHKCITPPETNTRPPVADIIGDSFDRMPPRRNKTVSCLCDGEKEFVDTYGSPYVTHARYGLAACNSQKDEWYVPMKGSKPELQVLPYGTRTLIRKDVMRRNGGGKHTLDRGNVYSVPVFNVDTTASVTGQCAEYETIPNFKAPDQTKDTKR